MEDTRQLALKSPDLRFDTPYVCVNPRKSDSIQMYLGLKRLI